MTGLSPSLLTLMPLTLVAGFLMTKAGTQKRMLSWKHATWRCASCGQTKRRNCTCRR